MTRIDPERWGYLRSKAGLSITKVCSASAQTSVVVLGVEAGFSENLSLHVAGRLAQSVGGRLSELLAEQEVPQPEAECEDAEILGALLLESKFKLWLSTVSELTGWDRRRVRVAIGVLRQQLNGTGLTVSEGDAWCQLRATLKPAAFRVIKKVNRKMLLQRGLGMSEAKMLYRVWQAEVHNSPQIEATSNDMRVALGTLVNAGALVRDQGRLDGKSRHYGRVRLSEEARLAFRPFLPEAGTSRRPPRRQRVKPLRQAAHEGSAL